MLLDYLEQLNATNIVLASASPRRKDILNSLGLDFEIRPSTFEENLNKSDYTPAEYVVENSFRKAIDVAEQQQNAQLVIGCDTVVVYDNVILEKPKDKANARQMLQNLSGNTHQVFSGVTLVVPSSKLTGKQLVYKFAECSIVTFAKLDETLIDAYIETNEPMDKAGAYGIQAKGGMFVEKIEGDYNNIVGFPAHKFCAIVRQLLQEGHL
eukprot:GCRY01002938.1.p1 GENE.GCRY01002938.1~~GCRY01002938.1.p1  ORF type:complete len:210 (-),score=22.10 GCRY01002938.1:73-702(-)